MPVYKDKKRNTWYVSTYVEYKDGTRKRVMKRGFRTRKEAILYENELLFESALESSDNPLFSDVLDEFINHYEKRRKPSSVHRLKKESRLYFKPFFESKRIKDVGRSDVVRFHDFLLDKLSVNTAKNVHGYLVGMLNYAIKMEYINNNVASEVGGISATSETNIDYWTLEEFKEFIQVVEEGKHKAIYMLLFFSGARVGELLALQWKDVDFDNNIIDIHKTTSHQNEVASPKTQSSIRKIKIPNHTMNLLRQLKLTKPHKANYFVFGEYYRPFSRNGVQHTYNKIFKDKKTSVKRIRIHDFRHSHAAYLINNGFDIQIISKRLGHSKVSTTYDVYGHLYPHKEDDAVALMEKEFGVSEVVKLIK